MPSSSFERDMSCPRALDLEFLFFEKQKEKSNFGPRVYKHILASIKVSFTFWKVGVGKRV